MRHSVFALVFAAACIEPPQEVPDTELHIVSPTTGVTIDHHAAIVLQVEITGARPVDALVVAVDGTPQTDLAIQQPGPDCDPCAYRIAWGAGDVGEGTHVVTVSAGDAMDGIEMSFDDTPQLVDVAPMMNEDLLGVGVYTISTRIVERGRVTATIEIDGIPLAPQTSEQCRFRGCELTWEWHTDGTASGEHAIVLDVSDAMGHTTRAMRDVILDDIVKITSLEVTGISEAPTMEIEVYLFDAVTNQLLGCAGSAHGLVSVDRPDVLYNVDAQLVGTGGAPLRAAEIEGRMLRFEVWEDDDAPVCPVPVSPAGNNLVAQSPALSYADWKSLAEPTAFGNVVDLGISIGRPIVR